MGIQVQPCCCANNECDCDCSDYYDDFASLSGDWTPVAPESAGVVWAAAGTLTQTDDTENGTLELVPLDIPTPAGDFMACCSVKMVTPADPAAIGSLQIEAAISGGGGGSWRGIFRCQKTAGSVDKIQIYSNTLAAFSDVGTYVGGEVVTMKCFETPGSPGTFTERFCVDGVNVYEGAATAVTSNFDAAATLIAQLRSTNGGEWDDFCVQIEP